MEKEMFNVDELTKTSRLEIINEILLTMKDGALLAVFHNVVRECLERDTISVQHLSNYPISVAQNAARKNAITLPDKGAFILRAVEHGIEAHTASKVYDAVLA